MRLSILTRKTLGGVKTDLAGRVLQADDQPIPGLYAAGEVAGFGGGGVHGYRALEGTFLAAASSRVGVLGRPWLRRLSERVLLPYMSSDSVLSLPDHKRTVQSAGSLSLPLV